MSDTEHTPTPWEFEDIGEDEDNLRINQWERMEANKVAIAIIPVGYSEPFEAEQRANAAFIVKAVNAHDELVEHATYLVERLADAHDPMREADITIHAAALRAALSRIQS